uniref:Uncharacterized protein n=1 Tax=Cacopsylla melanoneura TaxID=428564 RepID=A0A8D9E7Z5_9HEMI
MKLTQHFLLVVAFCALSIAHAQDEYDPDDYIDDDDNTTTTAIPTEIPITTTNGSFTVEPTTEDPDFKFDDDDYLPQEAPSVSTSMRRNNQGVCLKDQTVRVMTKCLFKKCATKPRCSKAQIMNQIRRFIHEKDVKSWWIKLAKCLHVRVSLKTVSVFTKCYLMAIPT